MFESHDEAISELLKTQDLVRPAQLEALRQRPRTVGDSLASAAVKSGCLSLGRLLAGIADHLGCDHVPNPPAALTAELIAALPERLAVDYGVVAWRDDGGYLDVLVADPFNAQLGPDLAFALGRPVRIAVCDPAEVQRLIQQHYGTPLPAPGAMLPGATASENEPLVEEPSSADLASMAEQPPVVRFVDLVLGQAVRDKASDIHFEPFAGEFKIRYRIDGVLYEMAPPPKALALPIASRIKVLAGLDIAERRLPQDGRIRFPLETRSVDLRVSTLPTQFGESVVLRVLDQSSVQLDLTQLGLPADVLAGVREIIGRPHGILVVTGPTGSGKTTTLYSGLRAINVPDLKLLTAEDPVEYGIDGVMQVPVNAAAGLTFASAMRSFLRQDPDVIMVGEIRDLETAQVAIQASLTGHLVMSTLHTNDAPGAVTRLLDMGIEPFLVAATLEAVLAQRLVRRICPECRAACLPTAAELSQAGEAAKEWGGRVFFRGRGCAQCAETGYRGRMGIYEWLPMTDALRELVTEDAPALAIRQRAQEQGMRSLRDEGLRAALAGETTLEEVLKHT